MSVQGYPRPVTARIRAMLSAKRGSASGSPALRAGLSSPIDSASTRGSRAASVRACSALAEGGPGVAAAGVFGQRGIGEVQHVDDMTAMQPALENTLPYSTVFGVGVRCTNSITSVREDRLPLWS
jgi:hypothetical protein